MADSEDILGAQRAPDAVVNNMPPACVKGCQELAAQHETANDGNGEGVKDLGTDPGSGQTPTTVPDIEQHGLGQTQGQVTGQGDLLVTSNGVANVSMATTPFYTSSPSSQGSGVTDSSTVSISNLVSGVAHTTPSNNGGGAGDAGSVDVTAAWMASVNNAGSMPGPTDSAEPGHWDASTSQVANADAGDFTRSDLAVSSNNNNQSLENSQYNSGNPQYDSGNSQYNSGNSQYDSGLAYSGNFTDSVAVTSAASTGAWVDDGYVEMEQQQQPPMTSQSYAPTSSMSLPIATSTPCTKEFAATNRLDPLAGNVTEADNGLSTTTAPLASEVACSNNSSAGFGDVQGSAMVSVDNTAVHAEGDTGPNQEMSMGQNVEYSNIQSEAEGGIPHSGADSQKGTEAQVFVSESDVMASWNRGYVPEPSHTLPTTDTTPCTSAVFTQPAPPPALATAASQLAVSGGEGNVAAHHGGLVASMEHDVDVYFSSTVTDTGQSGMVYVHSQNTCEGSKTQTAVAAADLAAMHYGTQAVPATSSGQAPLSAPPQPSQEGCGETVDYARGSLAADAAALTFTTAQSYGSHFTTATTTTTSSSQSVESTCSPSAELTDCQQTATAGSAGSEVPGADFVSGPSAVAGVESDHISGFSAESDVGRDHVSGYSTESDMGSDHVSGHSAMSGVGRDQYSNDQDSGQDNQGQQVESHQDTDVAMQPQEADQGDTDQGSMQYTANQANTQQYLTSQEVTDQGHYRVDGQVANKVEDQFPVDGDVPDQFATDQFVTSPSAMDQSAMDQSAMDQSAMDQTAMQGGAALQAVEDQGHPEDTSHMQTGVSEGQVVGEDGQPEDMDQDGQQPHLTDPAFSQALQPASESENWTSGFSSLGLNSQQVSLGHSSFTSTLSAVSSLSSASSLSSLSTEVQAPDSMSFDQADSYFLQPGQVTSQGSTGTMSSGSIAMTGQLESGENQSDIPVSTSSDPGLAGPELEAEPGAEMTTILAVSTLPEQTGPSPAVTAQSILATMTSAAPVQSTLETTSTAVSLQSAPATESSAATTQSAPGSASPVATTKPAVTESQAYMLLTSMLQPSNIFPPRSPAPRGPAARSPRPSSTRPRQAFAVAAPTSSLLSSRMKLQEAVVSRMQAPGAATAAPVSAAAVPAVTAATVALVQSTTSTPATTATATTAASTTTVTVKLPNGTVQVIQLPTSLLSSLPGAGVSTSAVAGKPSASATSPAAAITALLAGSKLASATPSSTAHSAHQASASLLASAAAPVMSQQLSQPAASMLAALKTVKMAAEEAQGQAQAGLPVTMATAVEPQPGESPDTALQLSSPPPESVDKALSPPLASQSPSSTAATNTVVPPPRKPLTLAANWQVFRPEINLFFQWQNRDAMCWLDVVLVALSHSPTLRALLVPPPPALPPAEIEAGTFLLTLLRAHEQAQYLLQKVLRRGGGDLLGPLPAVTSSADSSDASSVEVSTSNDSSKTEDLPPGSQSPPSTLTSDSTVTFSQGPVEVTTTPSTTTQAASMDTDSTAAVVGPSTSTSAADGSPQDSSVSTSTSSSVSSDATSKPAPPKVTLTPEQLATLNSTQELGTAIWLLKEVREQCWEMLQPRLRCERGKNDSPVIALPMLVRDNALLKQKFCMNYNLVLVCDKCGFRKEDHHGNKILPSLPQVPADFSILQPCFLRNCFQCQAPDQRMNLCYQSLPDVVLLHFMKGLPSTVSLADLDFIFQGDQFSVTAIIEYKHNPDHFVVWIRNGDKWMKCDDLLSQFCHFASAPPDFPMDQCHVAMWERNVADIGARQLVDTPLSTVLSQVMLVSHDNKAPPPVVPARLAPRTPSTAPRAALNPLTRLPLPTQPRAAQTAQGTVPLLLRSGTSGGQVVQLTGSGVTGQAPVLVNMQQLLAAGGKTLVLQGAPSSTVAPSPASVVSPLCSIQIVSTTATTTVAQAATTPTATLVGPGLTRPTAVLTLPSSGATVTTTAQPVSLLANPAKPATASAGSQKGPGLARLTLGAKTGLVVGQPQVASSLTPVSSSPQAAGQRFVFRQQEAESPAKSSAGTSTRGRGRGQGSVRGRGRGRGRGAGEATVRLALPGQAIQVSAPAGSSPGGQIIMVSGGPHSPRPQQVLVSAVTSSAPTVLASPTPVTLPSNNTPIMLRALTPKSVQNLSGVASLHPLPAARLSVGPTPSSLSSVAAGVGTTAAANPTSSNQSHLLLRALAQKLCQPTGLSQAMTPATTEVAQLLQSVMVSSQAQPASTTAMRTLGQAPSTSTAARTIAVLQGEGGTSQVVTVTTPPLSAAQQVATSSPGAAIRLPLVTSLASPTAQAALGSPTLQVASTVAGQPTLVLGGVGGLTKTHVMVSSTSKTAQPQTGLPGSIVLPGKVAGTQTSSAAVGTAPISLLHAAATTSTATITGVPQTSAISSSLASSSGLTAVPASTVLTSPGKLTGIALSPPSQGTARLVLGSGSPVSGTVLSVGTQSPGTLRLSELQLPSRSRKQKLVPIAQEEGGTAASQAAEGAGGKKLKLSLGSPTSTGASVTLGSVGSLVHMAGAGLPSQTSAALLNPTSMSTTTSGASGLVLTATSSSVGVASPQAQPSTASHGTSPIQHLATSPTSVATAQTSPPVAAVAARATAPGRGRGGRGRGRGGRGGASQTKETARPPSPPQPVIISRSGRTIKRKYAEDYAYTDISPRGTGKKRNPPSDKTT